MEISFDVSRDFQNNSLINHTFLVSFVLFVVALGPNRSWRNEFDGGKACCDWGLWFVEGDDRNLG